MHVTLVLDYWCYILHSCSSFTNLQSYTTVSQLHVTFVNVLGLQPDYMLHVFRLVTCYIVII